MKIKVILFCFLALLPSMTRSEQPPPSNTQTPASVKAFVENIYSKLELQNSRGPIILRKLDNPDLKLLFTDSLEAEFEAARLCAQRFMANRKPDVSVVMSFPEGSIFTGEYEGMIKFEIVSSEDVANTIRVNIKVFLDKESSTIITLILHKKDETLKMDEILYRERKTTLRQTLMDLHAGLEYQEKENSLPR